MRNGLIFTWEATLPSPKGQHITFTFDILEAKIHFQQIQLGYTGLQVPAYRSNQLILCHPQGHRINSSLTRCYVHKHPFGIMQYVSCCFKLFQRPDGSVKWMDDEASRSQRCTALTWWKKVHATSTKIDCTVDNFFETAAGRVRCGGISQCFHLCCCVCLERLPSFESCISFHHCQEAKVLKGIDWSGATGCWW